MRYSTIIQEKCGFKGKVEFIDHLHGGDINTVYTIHANKKKWVVKQNDEQQFPKMLEKESRALQHLSKVNSGLYYPKVKKTFEDGGQQFLIMEHIEEGENNQESQIALGRGLAKQHKCTSPTFGWEEDNYMGSLIQKNTFTKDWNFFFAEYRLIPQTKLAFDKGLLEKKDIQQMERLCYLLGELFTVEPPALVHGDLWGGNYFISVNTQPILFDPAVYFGHREVDIAMTQLFGGFSKEFYASYHEEYPLVPGWENRMEFFQLYPNLIHLNLFGESYLSSIREVIRHF